MKVVPLSESRCGVARCDLSMKHKERCEALGYEMICCLPGMKMQMSLHRYRVRIYVSADGKVQSTLHLRWFSLQSGHVVMGYFPTLGVVMSGRPT